MITTIEGIEFEELNHEIVGKTTPKLSVWSIAYNVKDYIRDCIEGILSQVVDFQIELVIYDDASTDGTTDIIREYCNKYPDIVHAFIAKKNIYNAPNRKDVITQIKSLYMRGIYAAICEGDDYWCDRHKLQMQVDFLENNKEFVLTMHNAKRVNYQTNTQDLMKGEQPSHEIEPKEIITQKSGIWPTASMVGKKEVWLCEPFFFECGVGDWPMQLYAAAYGRIYYFENVMSVYRYMRAGSWSEQIVKNFDNELLHKVKMINFLEQYDGYTNRKYNTDIKYRKRLFYEDLVQGYKIPIRDFLQKCEKFNKDNNYIYEVIIKKLERIYRQNYDDRYLSRETEEFALEQDRLFIYGAGKFGTKMAEALNEKNIDFEGFVVSDDKKSDDFYMGKPVLKVSDILSENKEYGIIIAIYFSSEYEWQQLKDYIEKKGIEKYIYPYDIS